MSKQQRYTPEFKTEAVKLVLEQGIQQSLAARRLGQWQHCGYDSRHPHLREAQGGHSLT